MMKSFVIIILSLLLLISVNSFGQSDNAVSGSPKIIPETLHLIGYPKAKASGMVTITQKETNCWHHSVEVNVSPINAIPADNSYHLVFIPGVKQKYIGNVCFLSKEKKGSTTYEYDLEGPMSIKGGNIIIKEPFSIAGEDITKPSKDAPFLKISSDSNDPLVFLVKDIGLEYVSGKGSVLTPSGRVFNFFKKK